jgi:hypothetical protein
MMIRIIFEFYQIYSFPEFLKSETAEDFIYDLQPLSAGVGRKISVVFIRLLSKKGSRAPVVYRNHTNFLVYANSS